MPNLVECSGDKVNLIRPGIVICSVVPRVTRENRCAVNCRIEFSGTLTSGAEVVTRDMIG